MDFVVIIIVMVLLFLSMGLWIGYNIYMDTRPDRMRAIFLDASKNIRGRRVKINPDGKSFSIGKENKYSITEDCVYRVGTWRVPTSYYNLGQITPINIRDLKAENPISSEDFQIATESNIGRQIIEKFDNPVFTVTTSMMVILITIALANAVVYMQLNTSLDEIKTALGIVSNVE